MKTAGEMSRMNLVIQSPTSVEPATIVASGTLREHLGEVVEARRHDHPVLALRDVDPRAVVHRREPRQHPPRARPTSRSACGEP